jgi:streptomycin 6-kinase
MARMRTHFDGGTGPFPKKLVEEAEANYRDLSASMDDPVLLHGDFHHWNIMTAQRQPWLAIDPKGVIGEPAYEIAPFLLNPLGWLQKQPDPARITARRIDIFADHLSLDRTRIIRWAIYQSVLSAWWSLEDQGYGWQDAIEIAEILQTLSRRK